MPFPTPFITPSTQGLPWVILLIISVSIPACAPNDHPTLKNPYPALEDTGRRPSFTYFFRRAWVQTTRNMATTELPQVVPIDFAALEREDFAVAWIGHATQLLRVGGQWVLIDPALKKYVGPVDVLAPKRLTPLPFDLADMPRIDVVLISHDHPDHLDHRSVKLLAAQAGGPPRFLVPNGVGSWFEKMGITTSEEFGWWSGVTSNKTTFTFLPAQHGSGRSLTGRNRTLWGGWSIAYDDRRFYFAGDTAYSAELFSDIRLRIGSPDLAALPIGVYEPRELMRFEHMNPADALQAHLDLGATRSFGVHWATFQLGDDEPIQAARDLDDAITNSDVVDIDFITVPIGGVLRIPGR